MYIENSDWTRPGFSHRHKCLHQQKSNQNHYNRDGTHFFTLAGCTDVHVRASTLSCLLVLVSVFMEEADSVRLTCVISADRCSIVRSALIQWRTQVRQSLDNGCRKARTGIWDTPSMHGVSGYDRVWRKGAGKRELECGVSFQSRNQLQQNLEEACRKARLGV